MTIYIVIETADVEIIGIHTFTELQPAADAFAAIEQENMSNRCDDVSHEVAGTLLLSGDDSYAVQLIESEVKP